MGHFEVSQNSQISPNSSSILAKSETWGFSGQTRMRRMRTDVHTLQILGSPTQKALRKYIYCSLFVSTKRYNLEINSTTSSKVLGDQPTSLSPPSLFRGTPQRKNFGVFLGSVFWVGQIWNKGGGLKLIMIFSSSSYNIHHNNRTVSLLKGSSS